MSLQTPTKMDVVICGAKILLLWQKERIQTFTIYTNLADTCTEANSKGISFIIKTSCAFTDSIGVNGKTDTEEFFILYRAIEDMVKKGLLPDVQIAWINNVQGTREDEITEVYIDGVLKLTLPNSSLVPALTMKSLGSLASP